MADNDSNRLEENFESDATQSLMQAVERMRTRLHEAAVNAPPQIYQAIERLRELTQEQFASTGQRISTLAHELGESEEDLIEWLKLDIRTLELRLLQSLLSTTDTSRVELRQWLSQSDEEE